jgi:hypothetical protein
LALLSFERIILHTYNIFLLATDDTWCTNYELVTVTHVDTCDRTHYIICHNANNKLVPGGGSQLGSLISCKKCQSMLGGIFASQLSQTLLM